jgi:hypothetical protein
MHAGDVPGQHQLLLIEVLPDDLLHLVGGFEAQVNAGAQENEIEDQQKGQSKFGHEKSEAPHLSSSPPHAPAKNP